MCKSRGQQAFVILFWAGRRQKGKWMWSTIASFLSVPKSVAEGILGFFFPKKASSCAQRQKTDRATQPKSIPLRNSLNLILSVHSAEIPLISSNTMYYWLNYCSIFFPALCSTYSRTVWCTVQKVNESCVNFWKLMGVWMETREGHSS